MLGWEGESRSGCCHGEDAVRELLRLLDAEDVLVHALWVVRRHAVGSHHRRHHRRVAAGRAVAAVEWPLLLVVVVELVVRCSVEVLQRVEHWRGEGVRWPVATPCP